MTPRKAQFYIYAESDEEVGRLEKALHDFVAEQYGKGVLVTASRLEGVLKKLGANPLIAHYLK